jgi:hypothetical protein
MLHPVPIGADLGWRQGVRLDKLDRLLRETAEFKDLREGRIAATNTDGDEPAGLFAAGAQDQTIGAQGGSQAFRRAQP